jgi:hypothetical protein
MWPGGKTPMDYFVVEFVEAGRSMPKQLFFCESSTDKAKEIAQAWKISQNLPGDPQVTKFEEQVFFEGRFWLKPNLSQVKMMDAGMKALGGEKPENKTMTPFALLGKKPRKK